MNLPISRNFLKLARPALLLAVVLQSPARAEDFQQYLQGTCSGAICTVDYDPVPPGKKMRVTKTSCYIRATDPDGNAYGIIKAVQLLLVKGNGNIGTAVTTPTMFTAAYYVPNTNNVTVVHQLNEEVQVTAKGGQHLRSYVELFSGTFDQVACNISGSLS